jgi:hypothetical protein
VKKVGRSLKVGDIIMFLGNPHRIIRFEPYANGLARIAWCDHDWTITVYDDAEFEVE